MKRGLDVQRRAALELFRMLLDDKIKEHRLRTLFWECTLRCNLACRHCGSDCKTAPVTRDMPLEDFLRVLDTITPHVEPHEVMIVFSGGEVLLRPDLERAGREVYERGYPWGMVTNGMLLDARRFDGLLRAGLHSITLSLDGFEPQHNWMRGNPQSFERAVRALDSIAAEPSVAYDVVTCVTRRNVDTLAEFRDFLVSRGVKSWRIFTVFPAGRAAEDPMLQLSDEQFRSLMDFIEAVRREGRIDASYACEGFLGRCEGRVRDHLYYCSAGVSTASIRIDGSISGCTSIRSDFNQGNIYRDDFMDVWNNRFEEFRDRSWAKRGQCADCDMFRFCRGGGMHLRDGNRELMMCHYRRLTGIL